MHRSKAQDYISFHDNDAARRAAAAAVYLKRRYEKRGSNTQWRISNILDAWRIHSWTPGRCHVRISGKAQPLEQSSELLEK
ncbi:MULTISPECIES: hypothetical protein [Paraburkholderia]|uniref:hypothetical protein n=1 Tax=Paraburkholderia TaxID=1822464 RepID=UPI00115F7D1E|nr:MULTISPECIES: hypothetical protein [Paraburkholderia]MBB5413062.1 hypothetical protein [Paraburkholderia sp. HC6.4b]MBB5455199.1 hypothetical protein [Paraburkholderia sp. Kb1A]MBC8720606.1 hypothetical protein [Paraburkholderia sp. 31.1]